MRRPGTRIASERALLVGDAAGLIDPVSGDGMYECFVSSRLAADAIVDLLGGRTESLAPYEAAVDEALMPLHNASWKLKQALDRWPRASWRIASAGLTWRSVERLLQGDLAHPGQERGLARVPLKALAALGR
jgi:flavin-dependent dehydrogenase